jgi:hypothetical protein
LLYGNNQDIFGEHTRLVGFNPSWTEGRIAFHSDPVEHGVNGDTCDGAPTGSSDMGANCVEVYFTATGNFSMPPGPGEATQCGSAGGGSNYAYVTWPRWAPDGSDLLYSYQMWPPNGNCSALPWQVARAYGGALPSQPGDQQADFSPNGSFIVLVNVLPGQTAGKIIIESNIGTNRRTLTQGYQPNWQPVP